MQIRQCYQIELFLDNLRIKNDSMEKRMWSSNQLTTSFFQSVYNQYEAYLVYEQDEVIGGFLLLENDFSYWSKEENLDECYYIHKLFLMNEYTKKGYSELIIEWIINKAKERNKIAIRLDCREYLYALNNRYENLGFKLKRQMISPISGKMNLRELKIQ